MLSCAGGCQSPMTRVPPGVPVAGLYDVPKSTLLMSPWLPPDAPGAAEVAGALAVLGADVCAGADEMVTPGVAVAWLPPQPAMMASMAAIASRRLTSGH